MADNTYLSRSGQINKAGATDALFRDQLQAEVITEFHAQQKVKPYVRYKEIENYSGDELQDKLNKANQKMADTVYNNTVELLGNMVNEGHGLMTLKYDLLD